jgi:hypothetical protein
MKTTHKQNLLATALIGALATASASAQSDNAAAPSTGTPGPTSAAPLAAPDQNLWQFGVTIPLWAPQVNGDVTIRGHQQNEDISFHELKDHLDASFALGLEASKGKFGLFSSVGYMKFSDSTQNTSSTLKFLIANAGASYLLLKTDGDRPFLLAGTAGIRYWYTDTTLGISPALVPPSGLNHTGIQNVVDPVVGIRGSQYLTQKFHLDFSADGGGFDLNHDTDWTWSAAGVATYDFTKWFSLSAGYQAVALDETEGSGASKNGVNLIFNGALITATVKF